MTTEKIFFSYARVDSAFVLKLAKDLREAGADVWLDQLDIPAGSHWDLEIEKAMKTANSMIAVLSTASTASPNFMDEVSYALEEGKKIIPVLLSDVETPFRLRRLQRIDFTVGYDIGFNQLLKELKLKMDDNEDKLWQRTKTGNSKDSYQSYLQAYPDGKYKMAASDAITALEKIEIEKVVSDPKISFESKAPPLQQQLRPGIKQKKYILLISGLVVLFLAAWFIFQMISSKSNKAELKEDTEEQQAWNIALEKNDTTAYREYQQKFPAGQYVLSAQQKIDSLRKEQQLINNNNEDDRAWNETLNANTIVAFQVYKKNHPDGKHVKEAESKIISLKKQKTERQDREDDLAWIAAVHTNTIAAFQAYQQKYPNGNHISEALSYVTTLKNRADDAAWNRAAAANTVKAYQEYQTEYPNGRHFSDASRRMKDLYSKPVLVNRIWNFRAVNKSDKELEIIVDYTYDGKHGTGFSVYMAAIAFQSNGTQVPRTHFEGYGGPGVVNVGTGTCKMLINKHADGSYISRTIKVCIISRQPFSDVLCETYNYTKQWK
jgi:hypothetical protein